MIRFPLLFSRSLSTFLAIALSGVLLLIAIGAGIAITTWNRTPADILPAESTRVLLVGETLSPFLSDFAPIQIPSALTPLVREASAHARVMTAGKETWVTFFRLHPGIRTYRDAMKLVREGNVDAQIVGRYLVWGFIPSEGARLSADPLYRTTLRTLGSNASTLYVKRSPEGSLPLRLPLFLKEIPNDADTVGIAERGDEKEFLLSLALPAPPSPPPASSFSVLPTLLAKPAFPLLFAAEGVDSEKDLERVIALLADADPEKELLFRGAVKAQLQKFGGSGATLTGPYTFLLRQGSGSQLEWVFVREGKDGGEIMGPPPVLIRERTLPSGVVVKDIRANPGGASDPGELTHAAKGDRTYVSNAGTFLETILEIPPSHLSASSQTTLHIDQASFEGPWKDFFRDSSFLSSLREFMGEAGSLSYSKDILGTHIRHIFRLRASSP